MIQQIPDVLVAGEFFVDLVMSGFNDLPQLGREVFAEQFVREAGGGTAITACGLASLELHCGAFGVVGAEDGDWLIRRLQERQVKTEQIQRKQGEATAFTVVATTQQDRAFLSYEGANRFLDEFLLTALSHGRLSRKHVHLAYAPALTTGVKLVELIHESGCTVSLDVGWREPWLQHPMAWEVLRRVDCFFPNLPEATRLTGQADPFQVLNFFTAQDVKHVALKMGADGAACLWDTAISLVPALPVTPVDTTGAGDSFDAGFLQGWLTGCGPEECLLRANICGALSTKAYGGITGFPSLVTLQQELQKSQNAQNSGRQFYG